jgi:hypothetical protein
MKNKLLLVRTEKSMFTSKRDDMSTEEERNRLTGTLPPSLP